MASLSDLYTGGPSGGAVERVPGQGEPYQTAGGGDWFSQWNQPNAGILEPYGGQSPESIAKYGYGGSSDNIQPGQNIDRGNITFRQPWSQTDVGGGAAGGGDWISQALSGAQSTDDPAYWRRVIAEDPKVAAGDQSAIDYWKMRIAQGDGAAATRSGQQSAYGSSGGNGGTMPGTLISPYGGQFSLPTEQEFMNMPGLQGALKAASRAVERSASAKGTLLSGGTMEDLQNAAIGTASQQYGNLANLSLGVQQGNYGIFRNNQNDPFNKLFSLGELGLRGTAGAAGAASGYAGDTANLQTSQGNANAAGTLAQGNNNANVVNSLGQLGGDLLGQWKNRSTDNSQLIYGPGY